jgi:nitrous oxidase accessory protein NosD
MDDSFIYNNTIKSGYSGIMFQRGIRNIISHNYIANSNWYGLTLFSRCSENVIHHNRFIDNGIKPREQEKIYSQARDFGIDNIWYEESTKEGNFWSDLKKIPYLIDGSANSTDPYPINFLIDTYLITHPMFTNLPIFLLLIFIIVKRRKRIKNTKNSNHLL